MQKANKMLALMKAASDGKGTPDPFWDNAARKLYTNLFILHYNVQQAYTEAAPAEKEQFESPPMSFHFLNLLLMDRGQPKNQAELSGCHETYRRYWADYISGLEKLQTITSRLELELDSMTAILEKAEGQAESQAQALETEMRKHSSGPSANPAAENAWQRTMVDRRRTLGALQSKLNALRLLLEGNLDDEHRSLAIKCLKLREAITTLITATDDKQRAEASNGSAELSSRIAYMMRSAATSLDGLGETAFQVKETLIAFIDATDRSLAARDMVTKVKIPQPAYGALRKLLSQYELRLKSQERELQTDTVWAYFNEEYLSLANDRTAGSVAMVASNLVMMFVHPPFNDIFRPEGTFTFNNAIDEGRLVYLDMPTALYGKVANCAALVMKIDFFRAMLSRPRLHRRKKDGSLDSVLVNQIRPMTYFCDEFASVVSTGDETGEAGFLDKVREFRCGCILGVQSMPMLLKKLEKSETDAILTNTAVKIFLRNTDKETNEFASNLMGTEIKVNASVNQSATQAFFDANKQVGQRSFNTTHSKSNRFEVGVFTVLQKGEAIVTINPRFGKNQIQRVRFMGKALTDIDHEGLYPLPCTDPD